MVRLSYSFIFITRRNFPLITSPVQEDTINEIFKEAAEINNLSLTCFSGAMNYVVLTVESKDPLPAPFQISHYLRSDTSRRIRNDIALGVSHLPSLWRRESWISTTYPSVEEIENFLGEIN